MRIGVCVLAPKNTLSRLLSFLKLNPFRKFSFLSSLKTSITFAGRDEAAATPSPGSLNAFQTLSVAVTEKPTGRLGSLSATQCASPSPGQGPLYNHFSIAGRSNGFPKLRCGWPHSQTATGGPQWGGQGLSAGAGWTMVEPTQEDTHLSCIRPQIKWCSGEQIHSYIVPDAMEPLRVIDGA